MLLVPRNRALSDVAALRKGNMLLVNTFVERSRTSRLLNLLRLLKPAKENLAKIYNRMTS